MRFHESPIDITAGEGRRGGVVERVAPLPGLQCTTTTWVGQVMEHAALPPGGRGRAPTDKKPGWVSAWGTAIS